MSDRAELLSIHGQVPPKAAEAHSRPALAHLFWWFMCAQGGVIAAILLPVHILFQGILGPLDIVKVAEPSDLSLLGNPIVKLYLLVLIAIPFFHFAHRLRYLLVDFG